MLYIQDKSTYCSVEVVKSFMNEMAASKEKALLLIPGADVKSVLGEGDDVIQTHIESGAPSAVLYYCIY